MGIFNDIFDNSNNVRYYVEHLNSLKKVVRDEVREEVNKDVRIDNNFLVQVVKNRFGAGYCLYIEGIGYLYKDTLNSNVYYFDYNVYKTFSNIPTFVFKCVLSFDEEIYVDDKLCNVLFYIDDNRHFDSRSKTLYIEIVTNFFNMCKNYLNRVVENVCVSSRMGNMLVTIYYNSSKNVILRRKSNIDDMYKDYTLVNKKVTESYSKKVFEELQKGEDSIIRDFFIICLVGRYDEGVRYDIENYLGNYVNVKDMLNNIENYVYIVNNSVFYDLRNKYDEKFYRKNLVRIYEYMYNNVNRVIEYEDIYRKINDYYYSAYNVYVEGIKKKKVSVGTRVKYKVKEDDNYMDDEGNEIVKAGDIISGVVIGVDKNSVIVRWDNEKIGDDKMSISQLIIEKRVVREDFVNDNSKFSELKKMIKNDAIKNGLIYTGDDSDEKSDEKDVEVKYMTKEEYNKYKLRSKVTSDYVFVYDNVDIVYTIFYDEDGKEILGFYIK